MKYFALLLSIFLVACSRAPEEATTPTEVTVEDELVYDLTTEGHAPFAVGPFLCPSHRAPTDREMAVAEQHAILSAISPSHSIRLLELCKVEEAHNAVRQAEHERAIVLESTFLEARASFSRQLELMKGD